MLLNEKDIYFEFFYSPKREHYFLDLKSPILFYVSTK